MFTTLGVQVHDGRQTPDMHLCYPVATASGAEGATAEMKLSPGKDHVVFFIDGQPQGVLRLREVFAAWLRQLGYEVGPA